MNTTALKNSSDKIESRFQIASLPPEMKLEIQALVGARAAPFVKQLFLSWTVIAMAIGGALWAHNIFVSALAVVVVATRMNILGLLVHEQAHRLGIQGMKGDVITNLFAGYPLLAMSVENYASVHLAHHKYYFTEKDPDHLRKSGENWRFPKTWFGLLKLFARDLSGLSTFETIRGKNKVPASGEFRRAKPTPRWVRLGFFVLLVGSLTYFGVWSVFLVYWVLPLTTVLQVIIRWGAVTEHIYNTAGEPVELNTPIVITSWLDNLLLPNLNFAMHAYHHWHAFISFSKLPEVHRIYVKYGRVNEALVFRGYFGYLRFLVGDDGV